MNEFNTWDNPLAQTSTPASLRDNAWLYALDADNACQICLIFDWIKAAGTPAMPISCVSRRTRDKVRETWKEVCNSAPPMI